MQAPGADAPIEYEGPDTQHALQVALHIGHQLVGGAVEDLGGEEREGRAI